MTPRAKNVSPAMTMPVKLGLLLWKEYQRSIFSVFMCDLQ